MENKKRAFELNEEEHENLKNLVAAQGIIFEEEVEKNLEHIFGSDWSISSNVCFREKGMDEDPLFASRIMKLEAEHERDVAEHEGAALFDKHGI